MQDEARDVAVAAMMQAAFESDLHSSVDSTNSSFRTEIRCNITSADAVSLAAAPSCSSGSDSIIVMSMVATDALVQVQRSPGFVLAAWLLISFR